VRKLFFKTLRFFSCDYFLQKRNPNVLYIALFHRVSNEKTYYYSPMPAKVFDDLCAYFSRYFSVIRFSELKNQPIEPLKPALIISFDDGHRDVLEYALPILKKYKLKFNINLVTETLLTGMPQDNLVAYDALNSTKKSHYFNPQISASINIDKSRPIRTEMEFVRLFQSLNKEQRRQLRDDIISKLGGSRLKFSRMLTKEDVCCLKENGAEIGSHTYSHPILPNISYEEIEFELANSKVLLEKMFGEKVDIIAYPDGKYNNAIISKSREVGYKFLLLTGEMTNVLNGTLKQEFCRVGLYHDAFDENIARIFGFHESVNYLRSIVR